MGANKEKLLVSIMTRLMSFHVSGGLTFPKGVVEHIKAGKSRFEEAFIAATDLLESGGDKSTDAPSGFG